MNNTFCIVSSQLKIVKTEQTVKWVSKKCTLNNPEYTKKKRMGFWVGDTPQKIWLYEIVGEYIILPFGLLSELKKEFPNGIGEYTEYVTDFLEYRYIDYGADITLYDYQQKAVDELTNLHVFSVIGGIVKAPTGSGKTQMGLAIVAETGMKTLWLTHTRDLLKQSMNRAKELGFDVNCIGTITEGQVNIGTGITFATVQTMHKLDLPKYADTWDMVIVDECHRAVTNATKLTMFGKVLNNLKARVKIGLTATERADGLQQACEALIGNVISVTDISSVEDKIMQPMIIPSMTNIGISDECLSPEGTVIRSKLTTYLAMNVKRNKQILDNIHKDLNDGRRVIVLSDRVSQLEYLYENTDTESKELIIGTSRAKARNQSLENMVSGHSEVMFATYQLAKEGLDIPILSSLIMATPKSGVTDLTQSIGRVCRAYAGKPTPIVRDYIDKGRTFERAYKRRCTTYRKLKASFV